MVASHVMPCVFGILIGASHCDSTLAVKVIVLGGACN
jgi:hypothetical protein